MNKSVPVSVRILNKEFTVNCPEGAENQLFDAAQYLDQKMRDIRNHGRVIGTERIAIMAALNITHELLTFRQHKESYINNVSHQIQRLQNKLDEVLMGNVLSNESTTND